MLAAENERLFQGSGMRREQALGEQLAQNAENQRLMDDRYRDRGRLVAEQQALAADQSRMIDLERTLRDDAIRESLTERNQRINEASAFLQGGEALSMPGGQAALGSYTPPDVQGAYADSYNAQLNNYNIRQQNNSSWRNGLFGLGSAALTGGFF